MHDIQNILPSAAISRVAVAVRAIQTLSIQPALLLKSGGFMQQV
jgi:hypothetical protein